MATTPPHDEQPPKQRRKSLHYSKAGREAKAADDEAADEGVESEEEEVPAAVRRAEARAGQRLIRQLLQGGKEPREDVSRNRAIIRRVMLDYIKNELRQPTVQEICEATGLSDKTVKNHKRHIKLGDGKANIYQALTPDVVMAVFKKARGFTYQAERLMTVSQGAGMGSEVERHDYTMFVQPDTAAAKLWFQIVEGLSETTKTEHSGEVKTTGGGGFYFEYVVPEAPTND
jgi:hypothetical protein